MIWKIFFAALAIRLLYVIILYAAMGDSGLIGVDSDLYIDLAKNFSHAAAAGPLHGWDWLGPSTAIMPLYTGLISLAVFLFGTFAIPVSILTQCVMDSATCVLGYYTADAISPRLAVPAALAAAFNPTQIVMSGLFYPDTSFVFFIALFLFGAVRWLRMPTPGNAAIIAIGLCCAAFIRILIVPWAAVLLLFLLIVTMLRSRLSIFVVGQLACVALAFTLCIGLVLGRNVAKFNTWSLTSQGGLHLLYVVPWVKYAYDGTPWVKGNQELIQLANRRFPVPTDDPFELSRRYSQVAVEAWRSFGLLPTAKAWVYGAVIDLGSPATLLSPPMIQIPRKSVV